MVIELPACRGMFRKSILRLFRLISLSFVQTESVMIITVCFLLFFHTMSSCPIPSRVRIEEGLFEASSSLFHVKWCLKGLIFETFIHFLHKKLFENKERSKSTRFFGLVLNTSSPPARSSQAHFAFKEWSCYGSGLPCSSSSSGLLVCMVTLLSMLPYLPM